MAPPATGAARRAGRRPPAPAVGPSARRSASSSPQPRRGRPVGGCPRAATVAGRAPRGGEPAGRGGGGHHGGPGPGAPGRPPAGDRRRSRRPRRRMQAEVAQLAAPDRVVAQGIAARPDGARPRWWTCPEVPLERPAARVPRTRATSRHGRRHRQPPRHGARHGEPRRPPQPAHPGDAAAARRSCSCLMVLRLVQVQEFGHRHYAALSKAQLTQTVTVPAVRGGIYDRNGEVLAETVTRQTVVADPQIIKDPTAGGRRPGARCSACPATPSGPSSPSRSGFVYLAHRVPDAVAAKVTKMDLNGINLVPESQRVVPGRAAGPAGGGHGGLERRRAPRASSTSTSRSWPARPGRPTSCESPDGVALPERRRLDAGPARHRPGAHPRRVGAVRDRAGPGRRDRGLPRHRGHGGDHGREDRGHPGHGQPGRPTTAGRRPPAPRPATGRPP